MSATILEKSGVTLQARDVLEARSVFGARGRLEGEVVVRSYVVRDAAGNRTEHRAMADAVAAFDAAVREVQA